MSRSPLARRPHVSVGLLQVVHGPVNLPELLPQEGSESNEAAAANTGRRPRIAQPFLLRSIFDFDFNEKRPIKIASTM